MSRPIKGECVSRPIKGEGMKSSFEELNQHGMQTGIMSKRKKNSRKDTKHAKLGRRLTNAGVFATCIVKVLFTCNSHNVQNTIFPHK